MRDTLLTIALVPLLACVSIIGYFMFNRMSLTTQLPVLEQEYNVIQKEIVRAQSYIEELEQSEVSNTNKRTASEFGNLFNSFLSQFKIFKQYTINEVTNRVQWDYQFSGQIEQLLEILEKSSEELANISYVVLDKVEIFQEDKLYQMKMRIVYEKE